MTELDVQKAVEQLGPILNREGRASRESDVLTPDAVKAIIDSRIIMMLAPKEYGGGGASLSEYYTALSQLVYADGPAGWSIMATSAHTGMFGAFLPQEGADELFAGDDHPRLPGMSAAVGRADRVDGGYRLTGRYQFASGSTVATQFVAGAALYENGEAVMHEDAPVALLMLVPAGQVTERGNWNVDGMGPTASIDYDVDDVFIEDRFVIRIHPAPVNGYRGPESLSVGLPTFSGGLHGSMCLGLAQRLIEEIAALAPTRGRAPGHKVSDNPVFKHEFAMLEIELRAGRNQFFRQIAEAEQYVAQHGGPNTAEGTARLLQLVAYLHDLGIRVANLAYSWAGSAAFRDDSAISRFYRDMNVARQHIMADKNNLALSADVVREALAANLRKLAE